MKLKLNLSVFCILIFGIIIFVQTNVEAASIVTYPMPSCYMESDVFSVSVGGESVPVIRYDDNTTTEYHYVHFSFSGNVDIKVTVNDSITSYRIRPESYGLAGAVNNNELTFSLSQSRYLLININSYQNLVIIADDLEVNAPSSSGEGIYNVKDNPYNADNTGEENVTAILQSAIDAANLAGSGTVYIPAGVYKISSITMLSNVNLYLEGGAVLRGTGITSDYVQDNSASNSQAITTFIRFKEGEMNIKVWGRGTLDANGEVLYDHGGGADPTALRICGIRPNKNSFVTIDGLIISHGRTWTVVPQQSDNILIQNVKVLNSENRNENDGIDINSCQDVLVKHCFTYTNDDSLCVKACSSGSFKGVIRGPNEDVYNVTFDDIVTYGRCAGTKVGIQGYTQTRNVWFKNIEVLQASRGIAIYHTQGNNIMENIHYENINVEDLVYRAYRPYPIQMEITAGGNVKNVVLKNINFKSFGDGSSGDGYNNAKSRILGLGPTSTIENVTFIDLKIADKLILNNTLDHIDINEYTSNITFIASKYNYEAEDLPFIVSSGDSHVILNNEGASGGKLTRGNFNEVGDYVQYSLNINQPGTYKVIVRHGIYSTRGMWQLQIDSLNQGPVVDGYKSGGMVFQEVDLGTVTFDTVGNKNFRFVVTGKNQSSSGFGTGIDLIQLIKIDTITAPILNYIDELGNSTNDLTANGIAEGLAYTEFPQEATLIMSLYNNENMLEKVKTSKTIYSGSNIAQMTVALDLPDTLNGHYIKLYLWDSIVGMKPLY